MTKTITETGLLLRTCTSADAHTSDLRGGEFGGRHSLRPDRETFGVSVSQRFISADMANDRYDQGKQTTTSTTSATRTNKWSIDKGMHVQGQRAA